MHPKHQLHECRLDNCVVWVPLKPYVEVVTTPHVHHRMPTTTMPRTSERAHALESIDDAIESMVCSSIFACSESDAVDKNGIEDGIEDRMRI